MEVKKGSIIKVGTEEYEVLKIHNSFCWRLRNTFTNEIVNIFYATDTHYRIIK